LRIWSDFWDAGEGIRTLKLLDEAAYPTTYEEDELRAFTLTHWIFFYTDSYGREPHRDYVEILWPNIDGHVQIWREKKSENYWAAGEAMKADLIAAGVAPPDWPTKSKTAGALDADIPF